MDDQQTQNDSEQILPTVQGSGQADDEQADDQTVPTSRALVTTPEEAADSDLIEKEWVIKAKQIVEHTAEDPFRQQEELSKMKADYMKKRYNKDVGSIQG
jgi:hypothetical protein